LAILRIDVLVPFLAAAATACPAPPPTAQPRADRPRYVVDIRVAPSLRTVSGVVRVSFTPNRPTGRLVFRLWPNAPRERQEGMRLDIGHVNYPVTRPDPTTLVVHAGKLRPGRAVDVRVPWTLRVPRARDDRISRFPNGLRLGTFLPLLAWNPRRGWVTDPPARILAESSTFPAADFDVRLQVPRGLDAVVSGVRVGPRRWRARAIRDIAVEVARFRILTATAHAADPVAVRLAVPRGMNVEARRLLRIAVTALEKLSVRYGPYPRPVYTLALAPDLFGGGIEYPTFTFFAVSRYVIGVVDHETAHQWFYSLVGNDQAKDPWLDETLATWGQQRIDRMIRPARGFLPPGVRRHVGAPMTYWSRFPRGYFYGVYEEGANALRSLGDDDKVDCALRAYAARQAYAIAQPGDLLDELNRVIPGAERRLADWGIHR
jgi:hypothetical protein